MPALVDELLATGYQGLFAIELDYMDPKYVDEDLAVEQSVRYLQGLQQRAVRSKGGSLRLRFFLGDGSKSFERPDPSAAPRESSEESPSAVRVRLLRAGRQPCNDGAKAATTPKTLAMKGSDPIKVRLHTH
jgi:hypothetical protein